MIYFFRLPFNENVFDEFLENKEINNPNFKDELLGGEMNDANLNPGFDIEAYRQQQLDLHNHYRSLHKVQSMTKDDEYVIFFCQTFVAIEILNFVIIVVMYVILALIKVMVLIGMMCSCSDGAVLVAIMMVL